MSDDWKTFGQAPPSTNGAVIEVFARNADRLVFTGKLVDLHSWATYVNGAWCFHSATVRDANRSQLKRLGAVWRNVTPPAEDVLIKLTGKPSK